MSTIKARCDGGMDQHGSGGGFKNYLDSASSLKVELTRFASGFCVWCERKREVKDDSRVFVLILRWGRLCGEQILVGNSKSLVLGMLTLRCLLDIQVEMPNRHLGKLD